MPSAEREDEGHNVAHSFSCESGRKLRFESLGGRPVPEAQGKLHPRGSVSA